MMIDTNSKWKTLVEHGTQRLCYRIHQDYPYLENSKSSIEVRRAFLVQDLDGPYYLLSDRALIEIKSEEIEPLKDLLIKMTEVKKEN